MTMLAYSMVKTHGTDLSLIVYWRTSPASSATSLPANWNLDFFLRCHRRCSAHGGRIAPLLHGFRNGLLYFRIRAKDLHVLQLSLLADDAVDVHRRARISSHRRIGKLRRGRLQRLGRLHVFTSVKFRGAGRDG